MMLTLFEQAIPMSNVAYYKAETDEALSNINEVIAHPMQQGNQPLSLESDVHQPFVEVKNVDFKYWNQSNYTLKELKLRVHEGEHVAIIGPSGSGKSTLLQLILGLYKSENGVVLINNHPDITPLLDSNIYSSINTLLQSQQLFDGTGHDNLDTDKDEAVIKEFFDTLGLSHIELDRHITHTGNTLSGGEIQRIGIA